MEQDRQQRKAKLKLVIVWLAILLLSSFWLSMRSTSDPAILTVLPEAPREQEPVLVTFKLNNPSAKDADFEYQFFTNGSLLKRGTTRVAAHSTKKYQYAYENPLEIGEQINFTLKVQAEEGTHMEHISLPAYPPQVWSSFVSFASFSTSVMSSMTTMTYYQTSFETGEALNMGLISSLVLIALLIYLELTQHLLPQKAITVLGRLRIRLSTLSMLLFIIFMGIVYTRVVLILVS